MQFSLKELANPNDILPSFTPCEIFIYTNLDGGTQMVRNQKGQSISIIDAEEEAISHEVSQEQFIDRLLDL